MRIRYTIISEQEDDPKNWDCETPEQAIEKIKKYIEGDVDYVLGALDKFTIQTELISETSK